MTRSTWHVILAGVVVVTLAAAAYSDREISELDEWRLFLQALEASL